MSLLFKLVELCRQGQSLRRQLYATTDEWEIQELRRQIDHVQQKIDDIVEGVTADERRC